MINGQKITLGPILPTDFPALFRWGDDLEAARLNETYRPAIWKTQEEFWFHMGRDTTRVMFAIRKLGSSQIIGYVQITNIDAVHHSAMIGLRIGEEAERNKGFGKEALDLAVDYCWNHLNLSRLSLSVFANNPRGRAVYQAKGFEVEGTLRRAVFIDGDWLDVIVMSLLHPKRINEK
jgi:RimJ/RimL family protein N-acetyltransferase